MQKKIDLTIVTTIDFTNRRLNLIRTAHRFFKMCSRLNVVVSAAIAERCLLDKIISYIFRKAYKNVMVVNVDQRSNKDICNGKLRNKAVEVCDSEYVVISDIDLVFDSNTIEYIRCKIKQNKYVMLPCIYLSKQGCRLFKNNSELSEIIKSKRNVNHCAIPSSFICLRRCDYLKVGGFDERYIGHGYEDFDFMLRFFSSINKIDLNKINLWDETYKIPLFASGMRGELAMLSMDEILSNKFVIHLWHKKNLAYRKTRLDNRRIIQRKFSITTRHEEVGIRRYPVLKYITNYCERNNTTIEKFELLTM